MNRWPRLLAFLLCGFAVLPTGCTSAALQDCLATVNAQPAPADQSEALAQLTADSTVAVGCRFADADRKLRIAIDVRNDALHLAKTLHDSGALSDADLEKVREAGKQSRLALNAAVSALAGAREAHQTGTWASAFADVQSAIGQLLELVGGIS